MAMKGVVVASALLLGILDTSFAIPSCSGNLVHGVGRTKSGFEQYAADHRPKLAQPLRSSANKEASLMADYSESDGLVSRLRGGAGLAKKLGGKNLGMLIILLSLLYLPRAMGGCTARIIPETKTRKAQIQRLGCGMGLLVTNIMTLSGLAVVLFNSRQYDRHGRSKLKMRLTGSFIIGLGMLLVIAHAEPASVSWYSKTNAYLGLVMEWWGFVSLFYNFTPKFIAQVPRELGKLFGKAMGKSGQAEDWRSTEAARAREREADRLNRWAQAHSSHSQT